MLNYPTAEQIGLMYLYMIKKHTHIYRMITGDLITLINFVSVYLHVSFFNIVLMKTLK